LGFREAKYRLRASQRPLRCRRSGRQNEQVRIGDITIDAVIEREGPWRRPQDFFPAYDEAIFKRHSATMEPEVFNQALGMMVITYQTFVVRTPRYTIWWIPAPARTRVIRRRSIFPARSAGATSCLRSASLTTRWTMYSAHLHIDHTGWNTTLRDGRWVPTFPNAKYIFHKSEYAVWEVEHARGANPPGTVFRTIACRSSKQARRSGR